MMIKGQCIRILTKIQNVSLAEFSENVDLQKIISFNLFQIGELAKKLFDQFIAEYCGVPWKQIKGLRDRIVHGYDTINLEIIYNTANESILELSSYLSEIL